MPKFVPVVDNEKSQAEQRQDTEFDKHRRFDNPHKVDRGWQQGNVGWGVLGAFGSDNKDDAAQIIKRAEGSNKMVKNDKGLWVKAKELEEDTPQQSKPGRGRGRGVSVYDEMVSRTMGSADTERNSEPPRKGQYDDLGETHMKRKDRGGEKRNDDRHRDAAKPEDRGRDSYNKSQRSRSRSPDRRREDRRGGDRDDRRGRRDRSRSRSRSRSNDRHGHRSRDDRSDKGRDSRRRSRSRSRSPARKETSRRDSRDRRDDRSGDRSDGRRRDDRREDRDRRDDRREKDEHRKSDRHSPPRSRHSPARSKTNNRDRDSPAHKKKPIDTELTPEEAALQAEMMNSITAVQVINRFHEVFSQDKLFLSERLSSIGQVFSPEAVIASLKSGVVHITGKTGVEDSFAKTTASVPAISKRIYIEHVVDSTNTATMNGNSVKEGEEPAAVSTAQNAPKTPKVTFCLDFHRPGTAPGPGDKAKHTVLLYRCTGAQITHIWGMVDHEQLSQPEELEQNVIMKSKAWALAKPIVVKDLGGFDEACDAHFHNYDRMEVWGLF